MRILPRSGRIAWLARSRACLAEPPAEVALDDEEFRALRGGVGAIGELARQAQLARRGLARDVLLHPAAQALLGALEREIEQLCGLARRGDEPVIERVAHHRLDEARGFGGLQAPLVLSLELRLADEHRNERSAIGHHVVGGQRARALGLAEALGVILEAAQQRAAQARFMGAAVGRGNRVAVGMDEAVLDSRPRDRPFDRAVLAFLFHLAGEGLVDHQFLTLDVGGEVILQAPGEAEDRFGGNLALRVDEAGAQRQRISTPPNR